MKGHNNYEWGVRWPNGVVMPLPSRNQAYRSATLGQGELVKRKVGPWNPSTHKKNPDG